MHRAGFRRAGHLPTLVASLIHFDVSFMCWVMIGALGAFIADDLGLSGTQKGLMVAVPPLGGAAFRLLLGPLADRYGCKRLGQLTLGLTLVPLAWGALAAGTYPQILAIGLLLGIAGASFAVALPLVSRWYPPEYQGLAMGIAGAGNSGTAVAALVAPRVAERLGWHETFALAMLPVALVWLAFTLLAREPARSAGARTPRGALDLLREADARWLCLFYSVTFGGFVGLSGYLPIFFVDRFDMVKVTGAAFAALCAIVGSLLRPVGGALADRLGGTRVLVALLTVVAALVMPLAATPGLVPTVVLLAVTLGALGMGNGAVFQLVGHRMPQRVGAMTGLVGAAGGVGGFMLPFGFGALLSLTGGYGTGFGLLAVVAAAAAIAVGGRDRAWRRNPEVALGGLEGAVA